MGLHTFCRTASRALSIYHTCHFIETLGLTRALGSQKQSDCPMQCWIPCMKLRHWSSHSKGSSLPVDLMPASAGLATLPHMYADLLIGRSSGLAFHIPEMACDNQVDPVEVEKRREPSVQGRLELVTASQASCRVLSLLCLCVGSTET